ncbi:DUF4189 domain-containing protein [Xanthomonas arboricola]|uniref:DUF4189 domain-containing protein n=1 Tax=Xanthomonas arboricola TaxID=56448 RepID=UPI000E1EDC57|nr:DUF4189 domain-containing protein [Xanthomonas arboricola]
MLKATIILLGIALSCPAFAEQGCPAGQYPIGGQGAISCAPIPQDRPTVTQPRPTGKWLKTWGAVAVGVLDAAPRYGVPVGLASEAEAKREAMARCNRSGAQGCRIGTTFRNQCMAIGEPQIDGLPKPNGIIQFSGQPTEGEASAEALRRCMKENPGAQCKVIHTACSKQVFQEF